MNKHGSQLCEFFFLLGYISWKYQDMSVCINFMPLQLKQSLTKRQIKCFNINICKCKTCINYPFFHCFISGCALPNLLQFAETRVLPNYGADSCESDWGSNVNDGHICVKSDDQSSGACNVSILNAETCYRNTFQQIPLTHSCTATHTSKYVGYTY